MSVIILASTLPTLLLNPNSIRRKLAIQMQAADVDAGNTGRIHIGFGSQPVATVGHPDQGLILLQASSIEEPLSNLPLDKRYKQAVWATSSVANQSLTVDEEVEES